MNGKATKSRWSWEKLLSAAAVLFLAGMAAGGDRESSAASGRFSASDLAHHLIAKAGTSHGLCSLLGCRDAALALEILRGSQFFLHVQDPRQTIGGRRREGARHQRPLWHARPGGTTTPGFAAVCGQHRRSRAGRARRRSHRAESRCLRRRWRICRSRRSCASCVPADERFSGQRRMQKSN